MIIPGEPKTKILNANTYEEEICDYSFLPPDGKGFDTNFYRADGVVFCKTDYIEVLFSNLQFSGRKYILLTHQSDYPINKERFEKRPPCIKKWFGYNIQHDHPDLHPIPHGMSVHKGYAKKYVSYDHEWFSDNAMRLASKKKRTDKVYCNWGDTNPHRKDIIPILEANGIDYVFETGVDFRTYCENMSEYLFVISPPGNAPEAVRTFEALYMGSIPVVIDNLAYRYCDKLPIMKMPCTSPLVSRYASCDGYRELSKEKMDTFMKRFQDMEFTYEQLYWPYWRELIRSHL